MGTAQGSVSRSKLESDRRAVRGFGCAFLDLMYQQVGGLHLGASCVWAVMHLELDESPIFMYVTTVGCEESQRHGVTIIRVPQKR